MSWEEWKAPKLNNSSELFHLVKSHLAVASVAKLPISFPFLKDFMKAILPTDLLLVGAKTGAGKTQFLTELALGWSSLGKRVAFVALEAEPEEIEQRILYRIYVKLFLKDSQRDRSLFMDFRRWRLGELDSALSKYDKDAEELYKQETKNLHTHYMQKAEFTIIHLVDLMDEIQKSADVCIIDHLHYFDMLGSDSDMSGMKQLMKRIRELNVRSKIPFVMAAHLRKDLQKIMPSLDDFMGSSDISKIATCAVLLAPKPDSYNPEKGTVTTLFSVPKLRGGGGTPIIGEIEYSVWYQEYVPLYTLSFQNQKGDKISAIERDKYPKWAKTPEDQYTVEFDF